MLVLVEIGVFMLVVDLLIYLISYLSSWQLSCYLFVVSCEDSHLFCKFWHND
jgi:hypothetical protein